jgi:hypothetical protein
MTQILAEGQFTTISWGFTASICDSLQIAAKKTPTKSSDDFLASPCRWVEE